jgi:hypothetical protein
VAPGTCPVLVKQGQAGVTAKLYCLTSAFPVLMVKKRGWDVTFGEQNSASDSFASPVGAWQGRSSESPQPESKLPYEAI